MKTKTAAVAKRARLAISALHEIAKAGDAEAIMHLRGIGIGIAQDLSLLMMLPGEAAAAVAESAAQSDEWLVRVPAIQELRKDAIERQLPPSLGTRLTIRPSPTPRSGGTRCFDPKTKGGFAHQIWAFFDAAYGLNHFQSPPAEFSNAWVQNYMESIFLDGWHPENFGEWKNDSEKRMLFVTEKAMRLPLLTIETLPEWVDLGMEWAEAICLGKWNEFPWPQKIIDRAQTPSSKFAKSPRGCKVAVREWIKGGFSSLISAA